MRVLFFALEDDRWGPARLPAPLAARGLAVAALCGARNPLAATRFLARHFSLPSARSSRAMARALQRAASAWQPDLLIGADEQAVALLHALVRGRHQLDAPTEALLTRSLGDPTQHRALLFKHETSALAETLGVRVPPGDVATTAAEAEAIAARIGYPVYVKPGFGWSGRGIARCAGPAELRSSIPTPPRLARLRSLARRVLQRDWYPTEAAFGVQRAIAGAPAMFGAVAWHGEMLAGFAGLPIQTDGANGPSTVLRIEQHAEMEQMSRRMIRGLGAHGFIGFDFMIEHGTDAAYLLECNPRPIQTGHLGARIGIDLCASLAAALRSSAPPAVRQVEAKTVSLFPQEWFRDPASIYLQTPALVDIPWDDPGLLSLMVGRFPARFAFCNTNAECKTAQTFNAQNSAMHAR